MSPGGWRTPRGWGGWVRGVRGPRGWRRVFPVDVPLRRRESRCSVRPVPGSERRLRAAGHECERVGTRRCAGTAGEGSPGEGGVRVRGA